MLQEDAAHHPGGHAEKLGAIPPIHPTLIHQPEIRLVHQRGGLKGMAGILPAQIPDGEGVQLAVDHRSISSSACLPPRSSSRSQSVTAIVGSVG
jgi:hypothetical protein